MRSIVKTHEEFVDEVKNKFPHIDILGTYKNNREKILFHCNNCNYDFYSNSKNILNSNYGCKLCGYKATGDKIRKSSDNFKEDFSKTRPDLTLIGEYTGTKNKILCKCNACGNEFSSNASNLLSGSQCPECSKKRLRKMYRKPHEQFIKEIELLNPNIEIVSEYTKCSESISCRCKVCGNEWNAQAGNILGGAGCSKCRGGVKITHEEFMQRLKEKNNKIEVIGTYTSANTKILCRCIFCGREFMGRPADLLRGHACPHCKTSKGEQKIYEYLSLNNVNHEQQISFKDCRDSLPLPFDFGVKDYNNNLLFIVEYQGYQHYYPVDFAGEGEQWALDYFENKTKRHDNIKKEYCKEHNIPLLEIPYWEFNNIENILDTYLKEGA